MATLLAACMHGALGQPEFTGDAFVRDLVSRELGSVSCRAEFDPAPVIARVGHQGPADYWASPDRREPGVINHYQRWRYANFTLQVYTWFSDFGPSTWLQFFEVGAGSREVPDEILRDASVGRKLYVDDQFEVTLLRDAQDKLTSIRVACAEH